MNEKAPQAFRTISEVADDLDLPQHVLRFWETKFNQIRPMKSGGGRRYYRPDDIALVRAIRGLLYGQGYTIRGVQRLLKERGVKAVVGDAANEAAPLPAPDDPTLFAMPHEAVSDAPREMPSPEIPVASETPPVFGQLAVSLSSPLTRPLVSPSPPMLPGRVELAAIRDDLRACVARLAAARAG